MGTLKISSGARHGVLLEEENQHLIAIGGELPPTLSDFSGGLNSEKLPILEETTVEFVVVNLFLYHLPLFLRA